MRAHDIYLIPGFFGFTNLGQLKYFGHVRKLLTERCTARGIRAHVHVVKTSPTASLPRRAVRVLETIAACDDDESIVHLIGHSSGGLDARLLAAPDASLPTSLAVKRYAERIHTVVTVATPHHGTPLAAFFVSRLGQEVLEVLSLSTIYLLRIGHLPLQALLRIGAIFARWDNLAVNSALLDEVFALLLGRFSVGRRRAVEALFADVARDRGLLIQLTPEAMELFNATVRDRPGVRYASVITRSAPPGLRSLAATGLDPSGQAIHAMFATLYRLAMGKAPGRPSSLTPAQTRALRRAYGRLPALRANDGIVPTRSQVFGEIACAIQADHLDVIGHFHDPAHEPPHVDWLTSGSGFTHAMFESVWESVLDVILRAEQPSTRRAPARTGAAAGSARRPRG